MSSIHFAWIQHKSNDGFRTGVSLHSHTLHSVENLNFLPRAAAKICALVISPARQDLNLSNTFWTPPLSAHEAFHLEAGQIQSLGLKPLVSLTDHDNIDAAGRLHLVGETAHAPVSVEWTVPFGESFFHLGIHNLPPSQAHAMMESMAEFTASSCQVYLAELLEWISWNEGVLVVFNHPCWDEKGIGQGRHMFLLRQFLDRCGRYIHAFELNGLRGWEENRLAIALARSERRPLISGGDRHGCEPNANINLTNASTFSEFVSEIRTDCRSEVLFLDQYSESLAYRQLQCIADVLGDRPSDPLCRTRWSDRVYCHRLGGELQSFSEAWTHGAPWAVKAFVDLVRLSQQRHLRNALRVWLPPPREYAV